MAPNNTMLISFCNFSYWRCVEQSSCNARFQTSLVVSRQDVPSIEKQPTDHNHLPALNKYIRAKVCSEMRDSLRTKPLEPILQTYENVVTVCPYPKDLLPTHASLNSMMKRQVACGRPCLSKSRQDIKLEGEWAETQNGEPFLVKTERSDNDILIFTTASNLSVLSKCDTLYVDGTFKTCPKLFTQFFTIHGLVEEFVVPLVYVLLADKSCKTYFDMFNCLRTEMARHMLPLNPKVIISDFESGLIAAIKLQFPNALHAGCHFHFVQAVWRTVQDLQLVPAYKNDPEVRLILQLCWALAFVPAAEVLQQFDAIVDAIPQTREYVLRPFIAYFRTTWLNGIFPIPMWNKYGCDHKHRTNNAVESWHARLKRRSNNHPNIFVRVLSIKHEQALTEITLVQALNGGTPAPRRPKYVRLENRLLKLHGQHVDGAIRTQQLLRRVRFAAAKYQ